MVKKILKKYGGNTENDYKFLIEKVDTDKNGKFDDEWDGVLIKRFTIVNGKKNFIDQKFVLNSQIAAAFNELNINHTNLMAADNHNFNNNPKNNGGIKIADDNAINRIENGGQIPQAQRIIMQDDTSFAQYIKAGAGLGFGSELGHAAGDMLAGLFTGE